jgi:NlpC/P60 family
MNPGSPCRIQLGTRIRLFVSRIRSLPSSLEWIDSSLQERRLFSPRLTPRVSRLHIGVLAAAFFAAALWVTLLAGGQPRHWPTAAQQSPQGQTQEPSPSRDDGSRQTGQNQSSPYKPVSRYRMLTQKEERGIVKAVWAHTPYEPDVQDCSHTVHQIYAAAGYEYPYASSFDLYRGTANFVRVAHPQPGDLIAWPGHVGIVLSPKKHSFYSLVSTGLQAQDYRGAYWRGRGHARFYRYIVERNTPSQRPDESLTPTKTQQR